MSEKKATGKKSASKSSSKKTSKKTVQKKASSKKTAGVQESKNQKKKSEEVTGSMPGKSSQPASLGEAIKYPFRKWPRCYNFLWVFTIIGIVAIYGYMIRIIQELRKGNNQELPKFRFGYDLGQGWMVLLYALVLGIIVGVLEIVLANLHEALYAAFVIYFLLISPMLWIQFSENRNIGQGLDFKKATRLVFTDFGDYIVTYLKALVQGIVYMFAVILLFIGIGAYQFGMYYLFVDYYNRQIGKVE